MVSNPELEGCLGNINVKRMKKCHLEAGGNVRCLCTSLKFNET